MSGNGLVMLSCGEEVGKLLWEDDCGEMLLEEWL